MGAVKTLLITGAAGYLGRTTVAAARAQGHLVRALVRPNSAIPKAWQQDDGIIIIALDMADEGADFAPALDGADAVLHLAASLTGDDKQHARDSLLATQILYRALAISPVPVVLASSIAIYQGRAGMIDETSPVEPDPTGRDAYLQAKLGQERIASAAVQQGVSTRFLRLGAIYGPGRYWNGHIGVMVGPLVIRLAGRGAIPLCYIRHAAQALICAAKAEMPKSTVQVLNIVDDNLPDARSYLAAIRARKLMRPALRLALPWQVLLPVARLVDKSKLSRRGVLRAGLLRPATLLARMAPRQYSNARAKAVLGWAPADDFAQTLRHEPAL